jgi:geranylgeranyl diphosphate synthase, type I
MEKHQIIFKKWRKLIDLEIKKVLLDSVDKQFHQPVYYQIKTGGKRLRPILTIASCLACQGKIKHALKPAAGLEIIHNCTLIYDDIIDHSRSRRGKLTVWAKFGQSIAQCIGINYSVSSFQAANRSLNSNQISEIFSQTMKKIVEGEILDILFEQSGRKNEKYLIENRYKTITENDYLKMISRKTAFLIQSCCQVGGLAANAKKTEIKNLKNYGFNLGMAFQIKDDILDVFGQTKKFGKKIGKDIEENKLGNIVIFYALKQLSRENKNKLLKILRKNKVNNQDIKQAINLIKTTKAKEKACLLAEKYLIKARKELKLLPQNNWSQLLGEITGFVIKREV